MRHPWLSVVFLIASAAPAFAQDQTQPPTRRFDLYLGFEACRSLDDSVAHLEPSGRGNHVVLSLGWNLTERVAIVADRIAFGVAVSQLAGTRVDYSILAGPRIRFGRDSRLSPYGQVLVGAAHGTVGAATSLGPPDSQTLAQVGAGGGLDLRLRERVSLRLVQIDVRRVFGGPGPDTAIGVSAGAVFRFGERVHGGR